SVIIPVHNGSMWLDSCFKSITSQTILETMAIEVSIYNDGSTDNTKKIIEEWQSKLRGSEIYITVSHGAGQAKGVGFAKNQAVHQSSGEFLCFQDVDDEMLPCRISFQLEEARQHPRAIIGSKFIRDPPKSTPRFSRWANELDHKKLSVQIYTSHGPTVIMPTWFCSREVFHRVGKFSEAGKGTPEDLIFFYKHLDGGGTVRRIDECLLIYRYHQNAMTFSIHEDTIWNIRIQRLIDNELQKWPSFTIWNAGKQGRRFYRSLPPLLQDKVVAMCDIDQKKIGRRYQPYFPDDPKRTKTTRPIPIIGFQEASPPFVICIKLDLTDGEFEKNLASLRLMEGEDYVLFS
ncbi:UDP-GlcNAc:betaGal beta-1,3-N-acetylglucosaminyltransferase-like protein 1, partial [Frankliniella fusca]